MNERAKHDADAGTNTGKSDGGKTCAKAFVHCGILKPVKATGRPKAGKDYAGQRIEVLARPALETCWPTLRSDADSSPTRTKPRVGGA